MFNENIQQFNLQLCLEWHWVFLNSFGVIVDWYFSFTFNNKVSIIEKLQFWHSFRNFQLNLNINRAIYFWILDNNILYSHSNCCCVEKCLDFNLNKTTWNLFVISSEKKYKYGQKIELTTTTTREFMPQFGAWEEWGQDKSHKALEWRCQKCIQIERIHFISEPENLWMVESLRMLLKSKKRIILFFFSESGLAWLDSFHFIFKHYTTRNRGPQFTNMCAIKMICIYIGIASCLLCKTLQCTLYTLHSHPHTKPVNIYFVPNVSALNTCKILTRILR